MPSLDAIRADPHPEDRPGVFGGLKNDVIAAVVSYSLIHVVTRETQLTQQGEFIGTVCAPCSPGYL